MALCEKVFSIATVLEIIGRIHSARKKILFIILAYYLLLVALVVYLYIQLLPTKANMDLKANVKSLPIPYTLHQMYKTTELPARWRKTYETCAYHARNQTGFKHLLWTDDAVMQLIKKEYPWFLETYSSYKYAAQRFDAARYLVIYHYGGIYLDLDIICKEDLSSFLYKRATHKYQAMIPIGSAVTKHWLMNDVLVAPPKHPFFRQIITNLQVSCGWNLIFPFITVHLTTGPWFLSLTQRGYPYPEQILMIDYPTYKYNSFGSQHFGSWHTWDGYAPNLFFKLMLWIFPFVLLTLLYKLIWWFAHRIGMCQ